MNRIVKIFIVVFASVVAMLGACRAADLGVANFTFNAAHREMPVQALVWYPASTGRFAESVGGDAVFQGVKAFRNAKPAGAKHRLVIISHGAGGNAANLGWISSRLVDAGFVVVGLNHPGSTSGDSTPETNIEMWKRPQDLTRRIRARRARPARHIGR